jgi:hypothetical protein
MTLKLLKLRKHTPQRLAEFAELFYEFILYKPSLFKDIVLECGAVPNELVDLLVDLVRLETIEVRS